MTDNLRHWAELSKTDPAFTKDFTRSGGFRGTDINPTWRIMRMTERFGPVGIGWGMTEPHFEMVQEDAGRVVYCRVGIWYRDGDQKSETIWGVGGDVVSGKRGSGQAFVDDEAQKKAYTDALGNAMKAIGVSADVFLKQFNDSKYREEVGREFAEKRQDAKSSSRQPANSQQAPRPFDTGTFMARDAEDWAAKFAAKLEQAPSLEELNAFLDNNGSALGRLKADLPEKAARLMTAAAARQHFLSQAPRTGTEG